MNNCLKKGSFSGVKYSEPGGVREQTAVREATLIFDLSKTHRRESRYRVLTRDRVTLLRLLNKHGGRRDFFGVWVGLALNLSPIYLFGAG